MIAITSKMRVLIAIQPADFRCRIDGLCRLVRSRLSADPFSGVVFVFRSRAGRDIALLVRFRHARVTRCVSES
jgi:transposase